MTHAAKAAVWEARYDPFGVVRSVTDTAVQNLGLPGQWFQPEAGLWYNWHRSYDPTTGRYTTPGRIDGPVTHQSVPDIESLRRDLIVTALPVLNPVRPRGDVR
jgi:RHS repeat-associated protein